MPADFSGITIHNTLGAVLVGFAVSCAVYGILLTQIYTYFSRYPSDKPLFKLLIILILLLDTAGQAFIGHIVYYYNIVNFANPAALLSATVTWSFILQLTVGSVVGTIVKTYFAFRVWRFSQRNYFITGIIMLLSWGHLGLSLTFTSKAFDLHSVFEVVELRVLGTVALATGVLTDLVTAVSLCWFLSKLRTGYHQSDTLVNSLVRYAVSTGLLTGAVSVTTLVLYNIMPHNMIFISTYFIINKLYAISFLTSLNTRRVVAGSGTDKQGTSTHGTNMFHLGTRVAPSMGPAQLDNWESKVRNEGAEEWEQVQAMRYQDRGYRA